MAHSGFSASPRGIQNSMEAIFAWTELYPQNNRAMWQCISCAPQAQKTIVYSKRHYEKEGERSTRVVMYYPILRQDPPPLEAILVIFGRRAFIFFCLKALGKKWKMTPLLCACAVVITLETQKCRKRAPHSVEFNFFNNCDRQKRFSQNERRRADLQKVASDFLIFA